MDEHTLMIDSRYGMGSNVDFYVTFNPATAMHTGGYPTQVFKNVHKVELISVSLPTHYANTTDEQYVILDIEELNNRIHANTPHANGQFAILYTEKSTHPMPGYMVKMIKGHDFGDKIRTFDPPISALSRLTIKLRHAQTGEIIEDVSEFIPDGGGYCTFLFKITCKRSLA
jgi:hypothetical protein